MVRDHDSPPPPDLSPSDATRGPAYVYRVYDTERRLIYIGSTVNLWQRLSKHRSEAWWAYTASRVHAELRPTARDARRDERAAILAERPRWNRHEIRGQILHLPQEQFFDFVYGWAAALLVTEHHRPCSDMRDHHHDQLARYRSVYERRFGVPLSIDFDTLDLYANPVPTFETPPGSPTPAPAPALSTGDSR